MKRSPLKRFSPLRAKSGLERKSSLKRTAMKRPVKRSGYDLGMAGAWWASVVGTRSCAVCGERNRVEGHHILPKRDIKQWALSEGLTTADAQKYLWDERNGLPLCVDCHQRHETAFQRVPRRLLPDSAFEFAKEMDLDYLLDRYYPDM